MASESSLLDALHGIASRIEEDMSEKDVENAFLNENFYTILGYSGAGHDLRSEWKLPDDRRPDYVTLDDNESVTAVYEFKTSGRKLRPHEDQLFHYVDALKADYGVLTNGEELRLYKREGHSRMLSVSVEDVTESETADLSAALEKPEWDVTDPRSVEEYLDTLDPVELDGELGREHFFESFRLEPDSPFADLVTAMVDLLRELRDEQEAKFVKGAYDFWEASYASEPDEVPGSWEEFIDGKQSLRDFMFCLESGHALLARVLLAKATEDHDFFPSEKGLRRYFDELGGFDDEISLDAYPIAANGMIEEMRNQLVESLFEDDIFIWWTDGYAEQTASQHKNPYSRFEDVAKEGSDVSRVSRATRERFSRAVSEVIFAVLKFDFSRVEGDPLGNLYQRYFDPETRKALGEFYTPQPVIDYIMDGVGYDVGVSKERIIDPSCGSGTFLVEAVERYIEDVERYHDDPDWAEHLTELCTRPHVVGLDIHPFAVLMAQIRFMVTILPKYRAAKRESEQFTIRRLPIFRTDTLRNERELTGIDLGDDGMTQMTLDAMTEDNQDVKIPVPLPVEVEEGEVDDHEREGDFLVQRIRMPLFDTVKLNAGMRNFGEYFAALQGVLDVVKFHMHEEMWEYRGGLEEGIHRYTDRDYDGLEEFFEPYVQDILDTVRYLRVEHGDGRLFKMFEDTVLALVVKNYMEYDYVVGNPPYVRIQNLPDGQKAILDELYESTTGNYDLYCPFYEKGLEILREGGNLGYITSNQFMVTNYGEGLRQVLLDRSTVEEVHDFRDAPVFEDATNYPAIVFLQAENDVDTRSSNQIRCIRTRGDIDGHEGDLTQDVVQDIRQHSNNPGYKDELIEVFDYPQSELTSAYWSLCPPDEKEVLDKLERNSKTKINGITDAIFHGTQPGLNKVYVVTPTNADRIDSSDTGKTVTVVPRGSSKEFEIETDLLRPWLQGRDVQRWRCEWSGQHVILPYKIKTENGGIEVEIYSQNQLKENFPLTWKYFKEHEEQLKSRESGKMRGRSDWYAYTYPKSHQRFELPKIVGRQFSDHAQFMLDEDGDWYFKGAYGLLLEPEYQNLTDEICCQLNSKPLDFYFKHIATQKQGGYFAYRSQYVGKLPCFTQASDAEFDILVNTVNRIADVLDRQSKIHRFPEAYLGDYDGPLGYIDYEWQTRRYPVSADIQQLADGRFAVTAGRSDELTHPLMDRGDREENERRAKYVHAAVDGRNMKKGEEQTIPIPKTREGVERLLDALEADRQTVEATSIEELEAEIDEAVYDLFDLTADEREVVEEYLEVF
ncbi:N-6 DNA methylase (plasmid) [Halorussus salilacus]|uniref:Eco57I restriction-modification methylase domain-containing protein n=1 Tax=Halorussus salilacus TaxID=2953750 RepID=UPI0020A20FB3|nr:N-6 DNA methylase [Halorussus salilacus]USZ69806.1 N-6 DNA methylase [Halorussus salilacus]